MFNEIPAVFWMAVIGSFTFMVCLVLYYFAMSVKESNNTMKELTETIKRTNGILEEADLLVKDSREIVSRTSEIVGEVSANILTPIRTVGSVLSVVTGLIGGFRGDEK